MRKIIYPLIRLRKKFITNIYYTMKKIYYLLLLIAVTFPFSLVSCNNTDEEITSNPFDSISKGNINGRNKIVVISDLHLGNDLSYSENVKHLKRLEEFLTEVRSSTTIKELVLNGDILDEWYIPTRVNPYDGGSQADFI